MESNVNYISQRLSLRKPQIESLKMLASIADSYNLVKESNLPLTEKYHKIKSSGNYEKLTDFERSFPSVTFALATGVGKTRLMGAFISYLYMDKGIKNFLVVAPNLTIYNKLIDDFGNSSSPKYVFNGIRVQPRIVTGDNYNKVSTVRHVSQKSQQSFLDDEVTINIFNIAKINSEARGGKSPKIKRLTEVLGESYFQYLKNLEDLVILMDESHNYRAERGMDVLNELNPVLGLELTATPKTQKADFKNVVYEYTLAKAIKDKFVKMPAVGTRKNFSQADAKKLSETELDRLKIEDSIRVHEITKSNLAKYARDYRQKFVKPFILIVTRDTVHAREVYEFVNSESFFDGRYIGKVIEVHSNVEGEKKDDFFNKLLDLEKPTNETEIVIHVNMLREGWDVTNLFTIVPLRASHSEILTEQTLGRGLRLPYGVRTGVDEIDTLTVISHDRFDDIIKAARSEDSIIFKEYFIDPVAEEFNKTQEVIGGNSNIQIEIQKDKEALDKITDLSKKKEAEINIAVKEEFYGALFKSNSTNVNSFDDLNKPENKERIIQSVLTGFTDLDDRKEAEKKARDMFEDLMKIVKSQIIEIPRIVIQLSSPAKAIFQDFDLDTKNEFNYPPVEQEIFIKYLQDQETNTFSVISMNKTNKDSWPNLIVNELLNFSDIDYDLHGNLLFKLADQLIEFLNLRLKEDDKVDNVIKFNKKRLADSIYSQMQEHFKLEQGEFDRVEVKPFVEILSHNLIKFKEDEVYHYTKDFKGSELRTKIFNGFKKSCHSAYKFDSLPEKKFVEIVEQDKNVEKWLRPAPAQFQIYWNYGSSKYEPDFVVETIDMIYLVEVKDHTKLKDEDVLDKARAAVEFCNHATAYSRGYNKKEWAYLLIPDKEISISRDMKFFSSYIF